MTDTAKEKRTFADGCHKYGWLITIIANVLIVGLFVGGMRADLNSVADRMSRMERLLDQIVLKMIK
jgi:hypothetical protein